MAKEPRNSRTTDDGAAHKYFGMIPHTITRGKRGRGLSLPARWLYVYLKSVTGEGGICDKSTTTIVKEAQLGRGTIGPAKDELVAAGLITLSRREGKYHATDNIHLVDIWPENMQEFKNHGCTPDEQPSCTPDEQPTASVNSTKSATGCTPDEQLGCTPPVLGCTPPVLKNKDLENKTQDKDLNPPPDSPIGESSPPRGETASKVKRAKRYMPKEEKAQAALKVSVFDANFAPWLAGHYPDADADAQWDYFVRYCLSSARQYADFRAAFLNSFSWENSPAQRPEGGIASASPTGRLSYVEAQRIREAGVAQRFLGGNHAGSTGSTDIPSRDETVIDDVQFRTY